MLAAVDDLSRHGQRTIIESPQNVLGRGEVEKQLIAMTPLGRLGKPSVIGKVVVFRDSNWLTGEIILASGGLR